MVEENWNEGNKEDWEMFVESQKDTEILKTIMKAVPLVNGELGTMT